MTLALVKVHWKKTSKTMSHLLVSVFAVLTSHMSAMLSIPYEPKLVFISFILTLLLFYALNRGAHRISLASQSLLVV